MTQEDKKNEHYGRCLWCEEETQLSRTHIFPKVLGGLYSEYLTCAKCNSYLGETVESQILKNSIFAAALKVHGLKSSEEAYRFAEKVDEKTGNIIHFKGNEAIVVPRMLSENHFRADKKDLERYINNQFVKLQIKYPDEQVKEAKISTNTTIYEIGEDTFSIIMQPKQKSIISLRGLNILPSAGLVCKIVYEVAGLIGINQLSVFNRFKRHFIKINKSPEKNEIIFNKVVGQLILCNAIQEFGQLGNKEKHDYDNFHNITFWMTDNNILYVELSFFGYLKCYMIIGRITSAISVEIRSLCGWELYFSWNIPFVESKRKIISENDVQDIIGSNHNFIDEIFNSFEQKDLIED